MCFIKEGIIMKKLFKIIALMILAFSITACTPKVEVIKQEVYDVEKVDDLWIVEFESETYEFETIEIVFEESDYIREEHLYLYMYYEGERMVDIKLCYVIFLTY